MSNIDRHRLRPAGVSRPTSEPAPSPSGPTSTPTRYAPFEPHRSFPNMSNYSAPASAASAGWITFAYASFGLAAFMSGLGVWALPAELWVKGYMMMAMVFLTGATFTLAKTVRDEHEARRFANRLDEAKTEKLLMEINRG